MKTRVQHDIGELFLKLLQAIESSLEKANAKKNFLQDIYGGTTTTEKKCLDCNNSSLHVDNFIDISAPLLAHDNLESSLASMYSTEEEMCGDNAYLCAHCQRKVRAITRTRVSKLPRYLIVCLRRTDYDARRLESIKITKPFRFPFCMDMAPYVSSSDLAEYPEASLQFHLSGVVIHRGAIDNKRHLHGVSPCSSTSLFIMDNKLSMSFFFFFFFANFDTLEYHCDFHNYMIFRAQRLWEDLEEQKENHWTSSKDMLDFIKKAPEKFRCFKKKIDNSIVNEGKIANPLITLPLPKCDSGFVSSSEDEGPHSQQSHKAIDDDNNEKHKGKILDIENDHETEEKKEVSNDKDKNTEIDTETKMPAEDITKLPHWFDFNDASLYAVSLFPSHLFYRESLLLLWTSRTNTTDILIYRCANGSLPSQWPPEIPDFVKHMLEHDGEPESEDENDTIQLQLTQLTLLEEQSSEPLPPSPKIFPRRRRRGVALSIALITQNKKKCCICFLKITKYYIYQKQTKESDDNDIDNANANDKDKDNTHDTKMGGKNGSKRCYSEMVHTTDIPQEASRESEPVLKKRRPNGSNPLSSTRDSSAMSEMNEEKTVDKPSVIIKYSSKSKTLPNLHVFKTTPWSELVQRICDSTGIPESNLYVYKYLANQKPQKLECDLGKGGDSSRSTLKHLKLVNEDELLVYDSIADQCDDHDLKNSSESTTTTTTTTTTTMKRKKSLAELEYEKRKTSLMVHVSVKGEINLDDKHPSFCFYLDKHKYCLEDVWNELKNYFPSSFALESNGKGTFRFRCQNRIIRDWKQTLEKCADAQEELSEKKVTRLELRWENSKMPDEDDLIFECRYKDGDQPVGDTMKELIVKEHCTLALFKQQLMCCFEMDGYQSGDFDIRLAKKNWALGTIKDWNDVHQYNLSFRDKSLQELNFPKDDKKPSTKIILHRRLQKGQKKIIIQMECDPLTNKLVIDDALRRAICSDDINIFFPYSKKLNNANNNNSNNSNSNTDSCNNASNGTLHSAFNDLKINAGDALDDKNNSKLPEFDGVGDSIESLKKNIVDLFKFSNTKQVRLLTFEKARKPVRWHVLPDDQKVLNCAGKTVVCQLLNKAEEYNTKTHMLLFLYRRNVSKQCYHPTKYDLIVSKNLFKKIHAQFGSEFGIALEHIQLAKLHPLDHRWEELHETPTRRKKPKNNKANPANKPKRKPKPESSVDLTPSNPADTSAASCQQNEQNTDEEDDNDEFIRVVEPELFEADIIGIRDANENPENTDKWTTTYSEYKRQEYNQMRGSEEPQLYIHVSDNESNEEDEALPENE
ncbi:Ubiquitin carboxyl-terminal hydrolase family protein [Reticulomyxa filosa]|uniref:Ubiquitin carboxyl-terminal hydrolase family protein n=1 Tax=Reticulomyxa filosa TaxID=46433 RepID=X6MVT2_RETFI|nr:Ubiquitin carboxyl-terminal hydrolase family protein [Reticulomyxa filosa]|eukprot:ETO17929.1 Ubiquitin carboxyl-terminal hydrolase family protein [Reticulomyxa filosa]